MSIISEYLTNNGEKFGYIELEMVLVNYHVLVHLFGISSPVEDKACVDYSNALNVFVIMRNKYNGMRK